MKSELRIRVEGHAEQTLLIYTDDRQSQVPQGANFGGASITSEDPDGHFHGVSIPFSQLGQLIALLQVHFEAGQPRRRG